MINHSYASSRHTARGFVLVLTLMIIAASTILISLAVQRVRAYRVAHVLWIDRMSARHIAVSGISVAMSQLTTLDTKPTKPEEAKAWIKVLFDYCNRWQTFTLKESIDGLDAELQLYISCEQGKINVAQLYDAEKKRIVVPGVADSKALTEALDTQLKAIGGKEIPSLEKMLAALTKDKKQIDDVSQLITVMPEAQVSLFVTPEKTQALTDLFTTSRQGITLNPFLLSASVAEMLGLKIDKKKVPAKEFIELIQMPVIDWKVHWNKVLAPFYGKEFGSLSTTITPLFDTRFDATTFSVVSYGKVGKATQKLCAIIQKNHDKKAHHPYSIKKLYWI